MHESDKKMVYISPQMALVITNVATTCISRLREQLNDWQPISIPGFRHLYDFRSVPESERLIGELERLRQDLGEAFDLGDVDV